MLRALITSRWTFAAVLAITTVIACFFPERWLGWTKLPGEIENLLLGPFGHAANVTGEWLRPEPSTDPDLRQYSPESIRHIEEESEEWHRLCVIAQNRVKDLEQQLKEARAIFDEVPDMTLRQVRASVVVRAAGAQLGPVVLNRGERDGVSIDSVPLYNGQVLGRITSVSAVQSTLLPLAVRGGGLILAVIQSQSNPMAPLESLKAAQFQPVGDGTLSADVDRSAPIASGDVALLLDTAWPMVARGRKIGVVESVKVKDADPLRNTVIVRPQYQVAQLANVTLVTEEPANAETSDGVTP
jgi:cell shape-determining protein MreC